MSAHSLKKGDLVADPDNHSVIGTVRDVYITLLDDGTKLRQALVDFARHHGSIVAPIEHFVSR